MWLGQFLHVNILLSFFLSLIFAIFPWIEKYVFSVKYKGTWWLTF